MSLTKSLKFFQYYRWVLVVNLDLIISRNRKYETRFPDLWIHSKRIPDAKITNRKVSRYFIQTFHSFLSFLQNFYNSCHRHASHEMFISSLTIQRRLLKRRASNRSETSPSNQLQERHIIIQKLLRDVLPSFHNRIADYRTVIKLTRFHSWTVQKR